MQQPVELPYFAHEMPQPEHNPLTPAGIELGRKLFFDPALSANGKVSCATCHRPKKAFSDGMALGNKGVSGNKLQRHAPALFNMAWHPAYFWDGGASDLESQMFGPLLHPDEMAVDLRKLVGYLEQDADYHLLFRQAFDCDTIYSAYIARALAQYTRTIISDNSPFDQYKQGKSSADAQVLEGYRLFQSKKCASCHPEPFFTDFQYHNNGLDSVLTAGELNIGLGRFRITLDSADLGKYKTPSLRNVALTAPYMYDGRFATLEDVLEHYNSGVQSSSTLDKRLEGGIALTEGESKALLVFLESLSGDFSRYE